MSLDCNKVKKNLGLSKCVKMPQMPKSMITTEIDFFLTPEQCATPTLAKAALQAAILAGRATRIYLWPTFTGFENLTEAPVYEKTPLANNFVRNGNYEMRFNIEQGLCFHKAMFSHQSNNGRAYILDIKNQLLGTEEAETGNFYGLTYNLLNPENIVLSDGSVSSKSPVMISFSDSTEVNERGALLDVPFIGTLIRLADVTLEVISATDTEWVIKVYVTCDETPVNGLVDADFVGTDAAGDVQAITMTTEDDGTYTFTGTALETGFIELVAASALSVPGYEAAATAVTVES